MYDYLIGKVKNIYYNSIVLDNNGIGYLIYTPNPYSFKIDEETQIYVYQKVSEDDISLYGFKTIEEKELFLKLISVKGLGPKLTLPILATGSVSGVIDAIERENILYLKKFPKIGEKVAKQIVLDLKGKLGVVTTNNTIVEENTIDELVEVLKGLGYKDKEVKQILPKVDISLPIEEQVKQALKLLLK